MNVTEELVRCRQYIDDALDYSGGTHTFDDIVLGVLSYRYQFWPLDDSCCITEIIEYPRKKVFHVFLAGGRLEQITALNEPFAKFAKANGCSSLTIAGRKGWEKVLNKLGWEFEFTTLKREI